jgi:hypothetical protein
MNLEYHTSKTFTREKFYGIVNLTNGNVSISIYCKKAKFSLTQKRPEIGTHKARKRSALVERKENVTSFIWKYSEKRLLDFSGICRGDV